MDDIDAFTAALIGTIDGFIAVTITIDTVIATTIDRFDLRTARQSGIIIEALW